MSVRNYLRALLLVVPLAASGTASAAPQSTDKDANAAVSRAELLHFTPRALLLFSSGTISTNLYGTTPQPLLEGVVLHSLMPSELIAN